MDRPAELKFGNDTNHSPLRNMGVVTLLELLKGTIGGHQACGSARDSNTRILHNRITLLCLSPLALGGADLKRGTH